MTLRDDTRTILETDGDPDTLSLRLRPQRRPLVLLVLGVWLIGWAGGEIYVTWALLSGQLTGGAAAFTLFWLAAWTYGGIQALNGFLWQLTGFERLTISRQEITVTRANAIWRRRTICDASAVTELRVTDLRDTTKTVAPPKNPGMLRGPKTPRDKGTIIFDYGGHTIGFGLSLAMDEARDVVALIHRRFPWLAPQPRRAKPRPAAT